MTPAPDGDSQKKAAPDGDSQKKAAPDGKSHNKWVDTGVNRLPLWVEEKLFNKMNLCPNKDNPRRFAFVNKLTQDDVEPVLMNTVVQLCIRARSGSS